MKLTRILSCLSALALAISAVAVPAAENTAAAAQADSGLPSTSPGINYADYLTASPKTANGGEEIEIVAADGYQPSADGKVTAGVIDDENALILNPSGGSVTWSFLCNQAGFYQVEFIYYPLENKTLDIEVSLELDGVIPYEEAQSFFLPRIWQDSEPIRQDAYGNDYNAQQQEVRTWLNTWFYAANGNYDEPMQLFLSAGMHSLTLLSEQEPFALSVIRLVPKSEPVSYQEYLSMHEQNHTAPGWSQLFEAEETYRKSDKSLLAQTDRSSIYTTPFSYTNQRLNMIGGENWNGSGEWIEWEITVPQDGFYRINFRYSQSYTQGLPVNRRLTVNGEVPFAEAENLQFQYSPDWDLFVLRDDGEEMLFWLQAGSNILRLEVTLGEVASIAAELQTIIRRLNDYYRRIIMITGSSPDVYRDYNIEAEIPDLLSAFREISEQLKNCRQYIDTLTAGKGDSGNILTVLSYQLDDMIKDPASIPFRMDSFNSNIGSLSSWSLDIKNQSLDLDSIYVSSCDVIEKPKAHENFFQSFKRELLYFLYSFVLDYNSFEAVGMKDSISVWINTGRDQTSIIRRMIDDLFAPQENIAVSLKLTSANAMQAFLSGNAPDIMLNVERGQPVNLALRGALYDLTRFPDYEQVIAQFSDTAAVPYTVEDRVYALPETEKFYMMFVREDILAEYGIIAPETWEEFYEAVQIIQLNGMRVGVPYTGVDSSTAVDSGIGGKNLLSAFLLQRGGSFYTADLKATALESPIAVAAFEEWTDLYTKYDLDLSYNFFNRFRSGEMPLAIALYSEYNQLRAAAPEIYGSWRMLPIPGTRQADGVINRSQGGTGTACVITSTTDHAESAWQFIKWWTGAEAQVRYASDLEASMGVSARLATANLEALSEIQWTSAEYEALAEQMKFVVEIPVAAGSYYLTRGIDNAFRETVYDGRNAKEALSVWNREIVDEMTRKREEFFHEEAS